MRQYRIGLLAVHSAIDYPRSIRMGAQNTIEEAGHTLVCFADLIPYHTLNNAEAYLRVAIELASRMDLDALIAPVGCMTALLSGDNDKAMELVANLDPIRTLILERNMEGYRCITKDDAPGMHACMRHLIETRGFTKIAFLSGPAHSRGAQERESIYFQEMKAHGLDTPPELFARGTFGGIAKDEINQLLDDNPDLEAIACACDLLAYTAYEVMHERKLAVGDDVAITGFDDNERSSHLDPPLSTVHMTGYDLGCLAAKEALRICAGLPQEEFVISSTFVARNSCGEDVHDGVISFHDLMQQDPFPAEEIVDIMTDAALTMAGPRVRRDFHEQMDTFLEKVRASYRLHRAHPEEHVLLFSSHDLSALFDQDYREHLSLEGFHSIAITLLEALLEISDGQEDASWVIEQISYLHLRIARLQSTDAQLSMLEADRREWVSFHMVDDALREDSNVQEAYRLILDEFKRLGVREADLFLLPEPVEFIGSRSFALSDKLRPIGTFSRGETEVAQGSETISLQELLDRVLPRYDEHAVCTLGAIMAGNELVGIALLDPGTLNDNGQLMAFLNLGFALKHLQMIAYEREINGLLNRNNLLLERQSQHDELTGLLNRRGFMNRLEHQLQTNTGRRAAIMYLDLDGLKTINDTFGHDAGDDAIRDTAHILRGCIPDDGLLARLGGDEFVSFVYADEDGDTDEGADTGAREGAIRQAIQDAMDAHNEKSLTPYELSISFGSARFTICDDTLRQVPQLMVEADEHLYTMKRKRHQSRSFDPRST